MGVIKTSIPANRDLENIWVYVAIEKQSPQNADQLLDEIDQSVKMLSDNPEVGTDVSDLMDNCRRYVFKKRFLIYFRPVSGGIEVLRVLHGARYIDSSLF